MNVLLIGSGGREHALAWKMAQSPLLKKLFICPGNAGTSEMGENLNLDPENFVEIGEFCLSRHIDLLVVGPEAPLVKGIHDYFLGKTELAKILVIGPVKEAAQLEGSKDFAKKFMTKYHIPTAQYRTFTKETTEKGKRFLHQLTPPYVLKADGLAAGKGVLILDDIEEAKKELDSMFEGKFGPASRKVVIEEFLSGIELSVFVLTDGDSYVILPEAKDYKRVGEKDTGLNTGGMGAVSPVPFADKKFMQKVEESIIKPTIDGLKQERITYQGFIFFGLINVKGDPFVIEYNVRMGDPECEVVIPRVKNDLLDLFIAVGKGNLATRRVEIDERAVATVMLVSGGYPGGYEKGKVLYNLEKTDNSILFHAGTNVKDKTVITSGGRVLAISSYGSGVKEALEQSYKNAGIIEFDKKYFRKDIGFDL